MPDKNKNKKNNPVLSLGKKKKSSKTKERACSDMCVSLCASSGFPYYITHTHTQKTEVQLRRAVKTLTSLLERLHAFLSDTRLSHGQVKKKLFVAPPTPPYAALIIRAAVGLSFSK